MMNLEINNLQTRVDEVSTRLLSIHERVESTKFEMIELIHQSGARTQCELKRVRNENTIGLAILSVLSVVNLIIHHS